MVPPVRDSKCSDLLAQWMSSSPLIGGGFTEAMDHAPLPAVHKTKVQAIRTYAEALFPAPYLIGLLLEMGATRSGFRVLSEYITRRGDTYTARTGLPFPRPIPTQDQFDGSWKSLTALLALSPPVECADPPSSGCCWPLLSWAQYVQSRPRGGGGGAWEGGSRRGKWGAGGLGGVFWGVFSRRAGGCGV